MEKIITDVIVHLDSFVLSFIRITALILSSPIFGRRNIPNVAKIGLCLMLTYIVFLSRPDTPAADIRDIWHYAMLCLLELLFGLILGYVTTLFFSIAQLAGYTIDMQMGFGMVNVFDVQSNLSVPITGNFLYVVMMIAFFTVNAHHRLVDILLSTFAYVPAGAVKLNPELGMAALEVFAKAFLLSLNVAMPVIVSGLLGEVILGFVVRTTPQMNVFVVGIPLKVLLGFMVLLIILPPYVAFSSTLFDEMFSAIGMMFQGLVSAT